jgi:hypothetical protein
MRQMISALVAAAAVMAATPALACGGLFGGGCSPCGYVGPCAYVQTYSGCGIGCGAAFERLPDPELQYHSAPAAFPQYYYVDQGPTYTGPGYFAPHRLYREEGISGWGTYHHRRHYWSYRHFRHWHHYHPHVLHSYY